MTVRAPVQPAYGSGQSLAPAAGSANVAIAKGTKQVILTNSGANPCYVRIGQDAAAVATIADYPVPAGAQVVVSKADDDNRLAHISALGTTLHVMNGEGF